jgi:hypothetical protein
MRGQRAVAKASITAFGEPEAALRERLKEARVNPEEFQRKLSRCCLADCRGMCCYGGVSVDDSTAAVLQRLAVDRAADFRDMGLELPEVVVAPTEWRGVVGNITALKPRPFRSMLADYPRHFDETACVFLMEDARCGLQVLAQRDGEHPWYYKPFGCWLLPIRVSNSEIRLYDDETDPLRFSHYDGFVSRTFCGRTCDRGLVAAEVLKPELEFLGRLVGRDLVAEASGQATEPPARQPPIAPGT